LGQTAINAQLLREVLFSACMDAWGILFSCAQIGIWDLRVDREVTRLLAFFWLNQ
jgi:hypothetical protein